MPRDLGLEGKEKENEKSVPLTESPNSTEFEINSSEEQQDGRFILQRRTLQDRANTSQNLHPYTRPLTISDLESCIALEDAAFPENERCSREKFIYRLNTCGELSLGLFCTATPDSDVQSPTLKTGRPVETSRSNGAVSVLLAHVIATRSNDEVVSDNAMDWPRDWETAKPDTDSKIGHTESGRTVCVHSLGVVPGYQGRGLGRTLMTAYMQNINGAGIADRMALIAHDYLVPYYEKLGFNSKGQSAALFGGGGWIDMTFELKSLEARAMYG